VAIGDREGVREAPDIAASDITVLDLRSVRELGIVAVIDRTLAHLRASGLTDVWLHLDADVLSDAVMPAVDSRALDGLTYEELVPLVRGLLASGLIAGMELTIYDPDLDSDGALAARLVDNVVAALAP